MPTLVTDFDGTLARRDFYSEVLTRLLPADTPQFYQAYLRGEMTHFECLASYFARIPGTEAELLALVAGMDLEPGLAGWVEKLRATGWEVVVASSGCAWYIERMLAAAGVDVPVHASPGRWVGDGRGLEMLPATGSPFFSPGFGIDKAAVVRDAATRGPVAFAGDGHTDVPAALLAPPERRFAKDDCAADLRQRGEHYVPFTNWGEVAAALLG